MNLRLLVAFLTVCSLSTGCIIVDRGHDHDPPPSALEGDVGFTWTLDGLACDQAPDVTSVRITIPGESLAGGGVYGCSTQGVMGIVLHDFQPGVYTFTLEAWDRSGDPLYAGHGSFTVNGDVAVHVDMRSVRPTVDLTWRLPDDSAPGLPTCEGAGTPYVAVFIDGVPQQAYVNGQPVQIQVDGEWRSVVPCEWGRSGQGFRVTLPSAGAHALELAAVDENGFKYYEYLGHVHGLTGQTVSADYSLVWAVGGFELQWQLYDGAEPKSCSAANVSKLYAYFRDLRYSPRFVYAYEPSYGQPFACTDGGAYFYLPAGTYDIYAGDAADLNGRYTTLHPPRITVRAGEFAVEPLVVEVDKL